jgi:hypothetical protein
MKVLHGACSCSFKQINKGSIKVFNTPYIKVLQVLLIECFPWGYCKPSGQSKHLMNVVLKFIKQNIQ